MKKVYIASIILMICLCVPVLNSQDKDEESLYKDDPEVISKIKKLGDQSGVVLGKFKVMPEDAAKYNHTFKKGPGVRNYCNKMVYAPERGTALYCGANHNVPHRLNDVWEFHLGANTWHLISPPGNDYKRINDLEGKAKKDKKFRESEEYKARLKKWWSTCTIKDGYLQAEKNGGPVNPRHTWDGLTYDHKTKKLYWAVLDLGEWKIKKYAQAMGLDADECLAKIKPASTMYMYDTIKRRWFRQIGEKPFPRMHGMGGTLVYLPDINKTIWYVAAQNRSPNDFGMWSYDAETNTWEELLSAASVRRQVQKEKSAPGSEVQAAYSEKHRTIVAVLKKGTFIYDVQTNTWAKGPGCPGYGHDAHGVFTYDSNADRFLLVSKISRRAKNEPWKLFAFDLTGKTWETVDIKGNNLPDDSKKPAWRTYCFAGYYDPGFNVLVLYEGRNRNTWVYRHKKISDKSPEE